MSPRDQQVTRSDSAASAPVGAIGANRPLVAFLGPSLPASEARRLTPGVEILPPVCQGDLATVVERTNPRGVLIVDGEFGQSLSVWHKEILHALHLGIRVVGAASMGALRAAELDRFGMEGVGAIYAYYRDGWLTADADVALLYADAEDGYEALTWPLVDIRATIEALSEQDALTPDDAAAVLHAAGAIHFTRRRRGAIAEQLVLEGMSASRADRLDDLLAAGYVNQKALDAAAGFEHLARLDEISPPVGEVPLHRDGRGFQPLLWSDVEIQRRAGSLRRYQLVDDVALHHPDFEALLERAVNRHLIGYLARDIGVEVTPAEVEEQRARTLSRLGLEEDGLSDWLVINDLDEAAFASLVESEAVNTRMRRWLVDTRLYERNRRFVIEQLQLEGEYAAAADAAARRRTLAECRPTTYPSTEKEIVDLLVRQMTISTWKPHTDLAKFADEQGFDSLGGLLVALSDSAAANIELQERRERVGRALGFDGDATGSPASTPPQAAARRTHALLEAHQVTQVLVTAVELGVPAALVDGPRSGAEIAAATRTDVARLERLLRALRATRIVTCDDDGRWSLTADGRALAPTAPGDEETLAAYADHVRTGSFPAWAGLADVIRGADPPSYPVDEMSDRLISAATEALGLVDAVIGSVVIPTGARVADIGGGLGQIAEALTARRPDITFALVELPATAERAKARLERLELGSRVEVIPFVGQRRLERPVDRCLLVRVIVTLDDAAAADLLSFARRSLGATGRVEVIDLEADDTPAAAFGDLLNLARSGGAVRSPDQWRELGRRTGLRLAARRSITAPFVHLSFEPVRGAEGQPAEEVNGR
jgi:hypothetical protein